MKKQYLSLLIFASLSCAANNEAFTSQFEGYIEGQESNSTLIQFAAIGSGFNYQGELLDSGAAVNVNFDFSFQLFDAPSGGNQVGSNIIKGNRAVTGGVFSIEDIDFGNSSYTGDALWLSVTVRETGNPGSETTLSPRQKIHAVPYAVQAEFGAGSSPWVVSGSSISYTGEANIGTALTAAPTNGLYVHANTYMGIRGAQASIDAKLDINSTASGATADPFRVRKNGDIRFYVDSNGGAGVGSWSTPPINGLRVAGDVKQPITSNGVMKYMVFADCGGSSPSVIRQYNGVSSGSITVTGSSVGRCIIDFPTDIDDRFWQVSVNYARTSISGISRTANCRLDTGSTDKLFCNITDPNVPEFRNGSIMVLVY